MYTKINNETCIKCDVCGEIFEEATYCLWFKEPQNKGIKGKEFHICDTAFQVEWQKNPKELCIVKFFEYKELQKHRLNFTRIFLHGAE